MGGLTDAEAPNAEPADAESTHVPTSSLVLAVPDEDDDDEGGW
jgi:hypothetical protein